MASRPVHNDELLMQDGWMTIDQFMDYLVPGLTDYLESNWGREYNTLHHPVDLATNASIYIDIASRVLQDFNRCIHEEH